jgi:hypothetical protein
MFKKCTLSLVLITSFFVVSTPLYAGVVDLATNVSGTATAATGQLTTFERFNNPPTGTGVFEPFVRIQAKGTEKGYNTDGTLEFDTKQGQTGGKNWTHSIKLGELLVTNGCIEFLLDINEDQGHDDEILSLDQLEIYLSDNPDNSGYPALGDLVYKLTDVSHDNWVILDNTIFNPGSGTGDMKVSIPVDQGWSADKYLYLYSEFGGHDNSNAGFEEWSARIVPEPATIALLGLGSLIVMKKRSGK